MTVNEAITMVDYLEPNQYTSEQKLKWLDQLDGKIFDELILTHEHDEDASYTRHTATTDALLVPFPYDQDVYVNYLKAMIAESNHESAKYNSSMVLFNTAYQQYASKYNRENIPLPAFRSNRLHF